MSRTSEFFEVDFPKVLSDYSQFTSGTNIRYKFVIADEGSWMIDLYTSPGSVYVTEDWGDAQAEMSSADFEWLLDNPRGGIILYNSGKIRLKGKTTLFETFYRFLELRPKI